MVPYFNCSQCFLILLLPFQWLFSFQWLDKIDFKIKNIIRDKERCYRIIKVLTQEEEIASVNICAPNIGAPQYIRQILTYIKKEIDINTKIVGDF